MKTYLLRSTAALLLLLAALLVWGQVELILYQLSLSQQHPILIAPEKVSQTPGRLRDKMRGLSPARRSLKQLHMENVERVNCTPFDPNTFHEKREAGEVNLEFMCVNETQLWDEIQRNKSLTQLKQYDAKSALLQAVLDSVDKDRISNDLEFVRYLQKFSMAEKMLPKVRKQHDSNALQQPIDHHIRIANSPVELQHNKFPANFMPEYPVLSENGKTLRDNVLQTVVENERYYQKLQSVRPHFYRVPNEYVPEDLPNFEEMFSQLSDEDGDQHLEKEDIDYLRDNNDGGNGYPNSKVSYPKQFWAPGNVPQFDMSHDQQVRGPQLWIRPRDVNNAARIAHPMQSVAGVQQLSDADLHKHFDRKLNGANIEVNPDLLPLRNFELPTNTDLHTSRHFPSSHNFSALADWMKYLDSAANISLPNFRSETQHSLNPDLLLRSRFQQKQMDKFCSENRITARLPSSGEDLDILFQHLLYDDSKRIVYCYVPKNGCSNMKRTFLILNGILPPESVAKRPPETKLKEVMSFRNLSKEEALYRLENYFKFAIVRNPIERLLSAYKNKLEPPLNIELRNHFPDKVKAYILKRYRKTKFLEWLYTEDKNKTVAIMPTFQEFLRFMAQFPLSLYNEHFMPVLNLCYPCAVQYDLYLNFKSLNYDVYALMDYLEIPKSYYPNAISHKRVPTSTHLNEYFRNVTKGAKERLFRVFAKELRFYYALHPEEWSMHRQLTAISKQ